MRLPSLETVDDLFSVLTEDVGIGNLISRLSNYSPRLLHTCRSFIERQAKVVSPKLICVKYGEVFELYYVHFLEIFPSRYAYSV